MLTLQNLDIFKEELIIINYKYNFIALRSSATRDSLRSCLTPFDSKTVFWESLESFNYIKTYLFLKRYRNEVKFTNLKELKDLQRLDLDNNQLTTVPDFNLPNLEYLYLHNNQLTTVPNFNLPQLKILSFNDNQLTSVPNFNLPNLQELY